MKNKPTWYTDEHDAGWNRVKNAFSKDWEQTKHDMGSDKARDLKQDAGDTVREATGGAKETFESHEPAFRFGYGAQQNYMKQYPKWNNDLETKLRNDYGSDFDRDRNDIRKSYEYKFDRSNENRPGERNENRT